MRNFKLLFITSILSLAFYSCSSDDKLENQDKHLGTKLSMYDQIGFHYNNALDFLASKIRPEIAPNIQKYKFVNEYF